MKLFNTKSRIRVKSKISSLSSLKGVKKELKSNFSFDWELEIQNEVFKLESIEDKEIIGLMSIMNIGEEYRIHINLLESSIPNRGKGKQIENIAHCLIAFACKQSFSLGYDGFVSLYPKTELIEYYMKEYKFERFGKYLAIYGSTSYNLIKEYLDD